MRHRGAVFWAWADPSLQHHSHKEMLADGARLDVQVRLSRTGDTQLFIGIYERSGLARIEEAYAKRPGEFGGARDYLIPSVMRPTQQLLGQSCPRLFNLGHAEGS